MTTGNRNEKSLYSNSIKTINWLRILKIYILNVNLDNRCKAVPLWIGKTVMRLCRILKRFVLITIKAKFADSVVTMLNMFLKRIYFTSL
jgi:hypothetical protein